MVPSPRRTKSPSLAIGVLAGRGLVSVVAILTELGKNRLRGGPLAAETTHAFLARTGAKDRRVWLMSRKQSSPRPAPRC